MTTNESRLPVYYPEIPEINCDKYQGKDLIELAKEIKTMQESLEEEGW